MKIRIIDADTRLSLRSGYGLMSKQIADNLSRLGHEVCFLPDDGSGEDIMFWIRPPHYVKQPEFDPSKKNVFYTMHESDTFEGWKSDWPELLNRCTAVITPTAWNKEVFEKRGVVVPIYVIPLGVNRKDFHGAKTDAFSIMTLHDALGADSSRESWKDTIKAYYSAFSGQHHEEVLLTIKSYNINRESYRKFLKSLGGDESANPPIDIIEIDLTKDSLNELYSKHWLFIKNANREGWSLPLLEAMAADLPVLYSDIPVLSWASEYSNGESFLPGDTARLSELMQAEFRKWKKKKGFVSKYSWKNCAKQVEEVLKAV